MTGNIRLAQQELVALVLAMREDWRFDDVQGALVAAGNAGVPWPKAAVQTVKLAADPEASPRELVPDWRDPTLRTAPAHHETVKGALDALHDTDWYKAKAEGARDGS